MIIGKSNHPVEIKRIDLCVWSLRDEIEKAIEIRLNETPEGEDIKLDDIKAFYNRQPRFMTHDNDSLDDDEDDDHITPEENAAEIII